MTSDSERAEAQHRGQILATTDECAKLLGMRVEVIAPGRAVAKMTVTPKLLNGIGGCHGGVLMALADSAFGYACQSRNAEITVAAAGQVDFLRPAALGDELVAEAIERSAAGRLGVYDVEIRNQHEELIAVFRGKSYRTARKLEP